MNISTKYDVPADVKNILEVACNDCHSNKTVYPWYSNIQPVAWWMNEHVDDASIRPDGSHYAYDRPNAASAEFVAMVGAIVSGHI